MMPFLDTYPDKSAALILKNGFSEGFRLGYNRDRKQRDSPNLKSVKQDPAKAIGKIKKEVDLGRIAGPFHSRPLPNLIVSPIGLAPKAEPGKFRLIQHLSFPDGDSINDGIDRAMCTVHYTHFDVAIQLVISAGKGALMAKADIQSAFRLLPVHADDFELLGMNVGGFFLD